MAQQVATMADGLQRVLMDIANTMTAPDADIQFLGALQQAIVQRVKQGNAPQAGPGGAPGQPPGAPPGAMGGAPGMPPGAMGGMMQNGPMGPGQAPGVPGVRSMPQMPNPDELRRMLAATVGAS